MVAANLRSIAAKSAGVPFAARSGVVLMQVDHFVRHSADQCVSMFERLRYADDVLAIFADVPTEHGRIAHDAKLDIIAIRQIPRREWLGLGKEVVAGAKCVGGHAPTRPNISAVQPDMERTRASRGLTCSHAARN